MNQFAVSLTKSATDPSVAKISMQFSLKRKQDWDILSPQAVGSLPIIYHQTDVNFYFFHQNHTYSGCLLFLDQENVSKCISAESLLILDYPGWHFVKGWQGTFLSISFPILYIKKTSRPLGGFMSIKISSPTALPLSNSCQHIVFQIDKIKLKTKNKSILKYELLRKEI